MNTSQNPPGVSCLVHSGHVAKQHESSLLYDIREGRLFCHTPHFVVGNAVVPAYIKDPPQAPLIQCINLSSISWQKFLTTIQNYKTAAKQISQLEVKTDPRSSDVRFDLSERADMCSDVTVYVVGQQLPETLSATQTQHNTQSYRVHTKRMTPTHPHMHCSIHQVILIIITNVHRTSDIFTLVAFIINKKA